MIQFRHFRNSDPPALCDIWRSQPPTRGLMQPITHSLLEELVFCKPHFDRRGLIVAVNERGPIGFVHAGFGPTGNRATLDRTRGITCLLMVGPEGSPGTAEDLLAHSEAYLATQDAQDFYGGWIGREAPFYQGLCGGCLSPGILRSDSRQTELYQSAGYKASKCCLVWQRELASFRPVIDREIMKLRRQLVLCRTPEAPPNNWWDACTVGQLDQIRFELLPHGKKRAAAAASFWNVEPLASSWAVHAMGLLELDVENGSQREQLATFLLGEALRELKSYGAAVVEIQSDVADHGLVAACRRLGFQEVDQGIQFRKAGYPTGPASEI